MIAFLSEVLNPLKTLNCRIWLIPNPDLQLKKKIKSRVDFFLPPLVTVFHSEESEAAKSLIQEVFLRCSRIQKVTVVEILIPVELITSAIAGLKNSNDSSRTIIRLSEPLLSPSICKAATSVYTSGLTSGTQESLEVTMMPPSPVGQLGLRGASVGGTGPSS